MNVPGHMRVLPGDTTTEHIGFGLIPLDWADCYNSGHRLIALPRV
jgi:hypothetical protein